ncbi:hypothetical protein J1614_004523, partial [Plenodomus biglobosus]
MHFSNPYITTLLALTHLTHATPLQTRQSPLKDFLVSSVAVGTPSGRPGSYPWASITASITDPNTIDLGNATTDGSPITVPAGSQGLNCHAQYFTRPVEPPLDHTYPCNPVSDGYWTMRVLPSSSSSGFSSTDFRLKFTHVADIAYQGAQYTAAFEAEGGFRVGQELSGQCGGSGVCGWGLAAGKSPLALEVKMV